jgi:signal recognition particle subunit SRP19
MRKLENQAIIWPAYFDIGKSRAEGRRVPKNQAIISPKIAEIKEAADNLNLQNEINLEARFPKNHWAKTGMLLVEKREAKEAIIRKLANQLLKIRTRQAQTSVRR